MYEIFLKSHLQKLEKLNTSKIKIVVYKGFPIKFIAEVLRDLRPLTPGIINQNYKIDLHKILREINNTIKNIFTLEAGIYVMTYEEFLVLAEKVDPEIFPVEFIVVVNNLYSEFPNQSTVEFPNLDELVEKSKVDFEQDQLMENFYLYSSFQYGLNLLQYRDIDRVKSANIKYIDFFSEEAISEIDLGVESVRQNQIGVSDIQTPEESREYFDLKYSPFFEGAIKHNQVSKVILNKLSFSNKQLIKEIKILKLIFENNGNKLEIKLKEEDSANKFRSEFVELLKKYWHSDSFRDLQFYSDPSRSKSKEVISQGSLIEEVVAEAEKAKNGKEFSDVFITAPTGAGKSLLFQISALYLANKYNLVTIIVSPLKALMVDQVTSLKAKGINSSAYINSDISLIERENIISQIKEGKKSILYLSPELLLSYDVRQFIGDRKLGLLIIDEAHLVTTWGRDFRVDYWYLGTYIKRLRKYMNSNSGDFPVMALTATAVYTGPDDIVFETIESLNMQLPKIHIGNVRRDEIDFVIRPFKPDGNHELKKIEKTKEEIIKSIDSNTKTVVYFPWINQISQAIDSLPEKYRSKVGRYYGDVDRMEKQIVYDQFKSGEIIVVLATKAFGMGIDVSDIKVVYHHAPSGDLSDYVQEVGRVARTKDVKGLAITDFSSKDLKFTKTLQGLSTIKQYQIKFILQKIKDLMSIKRSKQMLVSVEDFEFIFSGEEGGRAKLEGKIKSALLLAEKDLTLKVSNRYNVFIVRPKALFSLVYACIPKDIEKDFLKKYGKNCQLVATVKVNTEKNLGDSIIDDLGDIYEIRLDKIWAEFFSSESFPIVKKRFFDKELFPEFDKQLNPRYKLSILLNMSPEEMINKVQEYFTIIDKSIFSFSNKPFTADQLQKKLKQEFKNELLSRRITNLLISLYSSFFDMSSSNNMKSDTFIQSKINKDGEEVFKVVKSSYFKIRFLIVKKLQVMFNDENKVFEKYIGVNNSESEFRIKIAYLIESFLLGSYEINGGQLSQIYIRVNEPYKIVQYASDSSYTNEILQRIEESHARSVRIMTGFFNSVMENKERWDFIENYFLGDLQR